MGDSRYNDNTHLIRYSTVPKALHCRLVKDVTHLDVSEPAMLFFTFSIEFAVSLDGFSVKPTCDQTPIAVTRESLIGREERGA